MLFRSINLDRYNTPYMRLIMKFGGRAVDSGEKVLHVANLIKNYKNRGREIVGVFSAVDGMTDEILRVSESVKKGNKTTIEDFLVKTRDAHVKIIEYSIKNKDLKSKVMDIIEKLLSELFSTIEDNDLKKAKTQLESLKKKAPDLPEFMGAEALIRRKEILGR